MADPEGTGLDAAREREIAGVEERVASAREGGKDGPGEDDA